VTKIAQRANRRVMYFITIKCHALQERHINERDFTSSRMR